MTIAQDQLLTAVLCYLRGRNDLGEFSAPLHGLSLDDFQSFSIPSAVVPVQEKLSQWLPFSNDKTRPLVEAVIKASADMKWNRTYSEAEVGADFRQRYGWFDVVAPAGPFRRDCGLRMMVGCWGEGLDYQAHWHDPAEVYVPIAGSATFWAEGSGHKIAGVGDAVFHTPNQKHATNFDQSPFIALIIWRAENLGAQLSIEDRNTGKIIRPAEIK